LHSEWREEGGWHHGGGDGEEVGGEAGGVGSGARQLTIASDGGLASTTASSLGFWRGAVDRRRVGDEVARCRQGGAGGGGAGRRE
jgi:hypothetical protein